MSDRTAKIGRPSKGDRKRVPVRVPCAIAEGLPAAAAAAGYATVNDWIVDLTAIAQGRQPVYGDAEQLLAQLDTAAESIKREGQLAISA